MRLEPQFSQLFVCHLKSCSSVNLQNICGTKSKFKCAVGQPWESVLHMQRRTDKCRCMRDPCVAYNNNVESCGQ
jgi:hypothetical protein